MASDGFEPSSYHRSTCRIPAFWKMARSYNFLLNRTTHVMLSRLKRAAYCSTASVKTPGRSSRRSSVGVLNAANLPGTIHARSPSSSFSRVS